MKFKASLFAAPAALAAVLSIANCGGSDTADPSGTAGSPAAGGAGTGAAGKGGAAGSAAGAPAAGLGGGGTPSAAAGAGGTGGGVPSAGTAGKAGGSGGGTAGGAAVEATFNTVRSIIEMSCFGGNGCHGQEGNPMPLKLDSTLYASVTSHVTLNCGKLVDTTNAAQSALVKVMQGDCGTAPAVTARMPWDKCFEGEVDNEYCVAPAKIAAVQAWIAKGAPQ